MGYLGRILLLVALLVCNVYGSAVMLTAILPISKDINAPLATAQIVEAINMGIQAVNQQHIISSSFGVTLSVSFKDDQGSTKIALQETVRVATESPQTKGIIGGYYSSTSEVISIVADEYDIPQVSGSATISELSDKSIYPMFARTVPPDNEQAITIARLITLFGWSNVGVLYTTDSYAAGMQQNFQTACSQAGITIVAQEQFAAGGQLSVVKTILSVIQQQNIKIIVLFMQSNDAITVFQAASDLEMLDVDHAWIGSDSLESLDIPSSLINKLQGFMYTVATTSNGSMYDQFEQQLLASVPSPRSQYAASYYDIVFVYAYAINALLTKHGSYYDFNGTELYNAILSVQFSGVSRYIQFNANGDTFPALYSVYNLQNGAFVDIGNLSPTSTVAPKAIFFDGTTNPPDDDTRVNIINIALMLPFSTFENEITYKSSIAYVIDKLNEQSFVPGYTLVLISEDDQNNPGIGIVKAVDLANKGIPLLLGSDSSSVTKPIASVTSNLEIPQLSFISTSPELSDKSAYPYFLRNVPSDNAQSVAMASIIKNFGWTRVITVNTVEAYGSAAVQAFNDATSSYGITSIYGASFQVGQADLSGMMKDIASRDSTIFVTFVSYDDCPKFYAEVKRAGLMESPYVWINSDTCSSWGRSFNTTAFDADPSLGQAMKGMLGVITHSGGGQVYTDWIAEMASLNPIDYPGLSDVASVVYTSQSYDMMHLVATALRNMVIAGENFNDGPTLLEKLKNTTYQGLTGLNKFTENGDRVSDYDLLSWPYTNSTQYTAVGLWSQADNKLQIFNQLYWLGTDKSYPSYTPPDKFPTPPPKSSNNKVIIIVASVLGFLLLLAVALIAFFLMRRRKIHIQEKEKIPALIWEDEPLLGASVGSDNSPMLIASPSVTSDVARFIPTNGIDISKTDLTFALSKGDRFPVDKKLRDQVEITNTSNSVKKFRVYVPADVSRFKCQVYPGTGELRKNETVTFEIKFTLLLTTHINRKIKIEIDDNAPIYLSMNFKGDVSDKIDLDEIDIKGDQIGEGGFGTVYRGKFRGTEVAVKIAHSRNEHIKSFMNEFMREIDMMRRLHHPNITTFIGASFVPGKTGIVTEYCKRGSLAKLVHSGKSIPYGLKIKIAQDIANGVSFLHENGVLHRDLKPDNVLLASTNYMEQVCAKLTDFGTAKSVDQHTLNFNHTQGLGTPIYMSPEILQRKHYSTKVDVFSFGVLLWELYTQLHPFHFIKLHWNIPAFVLAGNRNPIPPDCPPELENLINRCWAAEPDDRPTFQQIGETLDKIYQPLKKQEKVKSALGKLSNRGEDDENGSNNSSPSSSPHPTNTGASIVHPTITSDSSMSHSHSHANVTTNSIPAFHHPSISSNSAAVHSSSTVKEYLREIELETVHNTNSNTNNNAL